jgi:type I restriction enzyme S subunit
MKSGYKQTEVGVIPEDWDVFSLSSLTEPQRPISYGIVQTGPNVPNGVRCLRVLDIQDGRINKAELITTSRKISDSYRRTVLKAGDLVMPLRGKVGDVGLVDAELDGANLTRGVALIAIQTGWLPVFCQQVISAASTRRRLEQAMNGSALQELPIASLRSFKIATPKTLPEQRAIAGALSDVDALLGAQEALLAKKRDLKAAAMQQLLTGETRLPGFSGEWEVKRLPDVCWFQEGPGVRNTQFTTSGVKLLNGTNIFRGRINLDTTERFIAEREAYGPYAHFLADCGDVIIACSGISVEKFHEKVAVVSAKHLPFCMNTSTMRFKPDQNSLVPDYLCHFLMSDLFKDQIAPQATGSAQLNFGPSHVSCVTLRLPSFPEQTAIAAVLSDMDAEIVALEAQRDKTRALKQGMMQELLTGRIRLL